MASSSAANARAIPVASPNNYLTLKALSWQKRAGHSREKREVNVLCGENPPTIVGGYGKWNILDRPLRQGVTVPLGFDPARLKVEVRFGVWDGRFHGVRSDNTTFGLGWDSRTVASEYVESAIDDLHWMAGGNFTAGPSPVLTLHSFHASHPKSETNLTPRQYRNVGWVIETGIEWWNSLRHSNGNRVYQEATFTLLGYTSLGTPAPKQQNFQAGGYFTTTRHRRTALSIAADRSAHVPEAAIRGLAKAILASPQNNPCHKSRVHLARRSISWPMPVPLQVWVPSHQM